MTKIDFVFTKEMAKLLKIVREKSNLSQVEIAKRIGFAPKSGKIYISLLENGKIKNPSLGLILRYLSTCSSSWPEFFKELDTIDFKLRHDKMIAQVHPPPTERKIQRDAMRYEIGVEFPSKEKEEIDFDRLKKQIKDKVTALVNKEGLTLTPTLSHQGRGGDAVIANYQKFAQEYFEFLTTLNKAGMKMVADKYHRAGLQLNLISKIKKIINSVLRGEIKRIESKKPLPTGKQEKMAIGFTKYRIRIEQIEAEVHKILCELGVQPPWFALYKDFARECYRILKRYYGKEILSDKFQAIIKRWVKEGLKEYVLLTVKEATIKVFARKNV
jgi:transcriptional regulator with XRE-family HTH domain